VKRTASGRGEGGGRSGSEAKTKICMMVRNLGSRRRREEGGSIIIKENYKGLSKTKKDRKWWCIEQGRGKRECTR